MFFEETFARSIVVQEIFGAKMDQILDGFGFAQTLFDKIKSITYT